MGGGNRRGHLIGDGVRGLVSGLFASGVMQKAQTLAIHLVFGAATAAGGRLLPGGT